MLDQITNTYLSDDTIKGNQSFGIISTIQNLYDSCLLTANVAISFAKKGFKTLLIDLNMSHPILGLLFNKKSYFQHTTTHFYLDDSNTSDHANILMENAFKKDFPTNGSITIIPASTDMKLKLKIQELTSSELKRNLTKLLTLMKNLRNNFDFIVINMPSGSDFRLLTHACLISDHNFLLLDHNSLSISYAIDLVANLENVHPLIEFHGLVLYKYEYNVNFVDDERPLIEQTFNLPIIATLPIIPGSHSFINEIELLKTTNIDPRIENYFKIFSQELIKFIEHPGFLMNEQKNDSFIDVLIIANKGGIPLFTSYLKRRSNEKSVTLSHDEILTSATLTAIITGITSVISEITKETSGETKLIKQKHLNLIIEYNNPLRAMILTPQSEESVRNKLISFLNLFKQKYRSEINNFVGSTKTFQEARYLVEEIF